VSSILVTRSTKVRVSVIEAQIADLASADSGQLGVATDQALWNLLSMPFAALGEPMPAAQIRKANLKHLVQGEKPYR
jgi:hypothetical protein